MRNAAFALAAGVSVLAGCTQNSAPTAPESTGTAVPSSVQATQSGYTISVFAAAPGTLQPDDLLQLNNTVFVIYQDTNDNPDGTIVPGTSPQSLVLEYDLGGNLLHTFKVPGHPDGEAAYNATTVWISSNEDANPIITVIDTTTNTMQSYTSDVATLPHGGGIDDMKVVAGVVYASGSNPTTTFDPIPNLAPYSTDSSGATLEYGVNTGPVIYALSLNGDGTTFHSTPVIMSSTPATLLPGNTPVTLNMTDPDSSAIDPSGDLVTVSQQDSELVFVHDIDTASPSVSVLPLTLYGNPWPIDDIRWAPAEGASFMLVSDNGNHLVYRIDYGGDNFPAGAAFAAGQGTVLQVNTGSGVMTPIYVGMNAPHGLMFISY